MAVVIKDEKDIIHKFNISYFVVNLFNSNNMVNLEIDPALEKMLSLQTTGNILACIIIGFLIVVIYYIWGSWNENKEK